MLHELLFTRVLRPLSGHSTALQPTTILIPTEIMLNVCEVKQYVQCVKLMRKLHRVNVTQEDDLGSD